MSRLIIRVLRIIFCVAAHRMGDFGDDDGTTRFVSDFLSVGSSFRDLPLHYVVNIMVESNPEERFNETCITRIGKSSVRLFNADTKIRYAIQPKRTMFRTTKDFVRYGSFTQILSFFILHRLVELVQAYFLVQHSCPGTPIRTVSITKERLLPRNLVCPT
jgi:hypothetical protein